MKKLNDIHLRAVELIVLEGKKQKEVAEIVGVAEETVSRWMREEAFINKYQELMRFRINRAAALAQQRVEELMFSQSENVALSAAKDILGRAGYDAVAKSEITQRTIVIDLGDEPEDTDGTEDSSETETI